MTVSSMVHDRRAELPPPLGGVAVAAGLLAVFATYWDEAWHTDVGRDTAWSAPHLLLYGAVAAVGMAVAGWGLCVLRRLGSLRLTLAQPPLVAAGLGGLGALVAAPIDAAWHQAYGRDAVLFSPPHMLVVLASLALVLGVIAGLPHKCQTLRWAAGVLLVANALAVLFEYEADVPQFTERLYLPLLIAVGLAVGYVIPRVVPGRFPVTSVVLGYAGLRLIITFSLVALDRSTPDLPIAILGFAVMDFARRAWSAAVAATAAVSGVALAASASGLASPNTEDVALVAVPVLVGCLLILALAHWGPVATMPWMFLIGTAAALAPADHASAHDPGQGTPVTRAEMSVQTDTSRRVLLMVRVREHCDDLVPRSIVARRAGMIVSGALTARGSCAYAGSLTLPRDGRWFVYANYLRAGSSVEAWVPVEVGSHNDVRMTRSLYVPAGQDVGANAGQLVAGGVVYLAGLGLVAMGVRAVRDRRGEIARPGSPG
jgi:hypothetical protein